MKPVKTEELADNFSDRKNQTEFMRKKNISDRNLVTIYLILNLRRKAEGAGLRKGAKPNPGDLLTNLCTG